MNGHKNALKYEWNKLDQKRINTLYVRELVEALQDDLLLSWGHISSICRTQIYVTNKTLF